MPSVRSISYAVTLGTGDGFGPEPIDDFILGVTKPVADGLWGVRNTGPRLDYDPDSPTLGWTDPVNGGSGPWTVIDGDYLLPSVGTYSKLWVKGQIRSTFSSGVVLQDCVQRARDGLATTKYGVYFQGASGTGLATANTVQFCDIGCPPSAQNYFQATGIRPNLFTGYRTKVWGYVDAVMPYGPTASLRGRVSLQGMHCYTGPHFATDGGAHADGTHNDGCQVEGNVGLEIIGSLLHGQYTSGLIATNNVSGGYDYLKVWDSWIDADTGAKMNLAGANLACDIKRNKLAHHTASLDINISTTNRIAANFGMTGTTGNVSGWVAGPDANVFEDTGTPCRVHNG